MHLYIISFASQRILSNQTRRRRPNHQRVTSILSVLSNLNVLYSIMSSGFPLVEWIAAG